MATKKEIKEILKENNLDEKTFDFIVSKLRKVNKKLNKVLVDSGKDWRGLNSFLLKEIIRIYDESKVDLFTGEVIELKGYEK